jgi:putative aldouronate transport system substrate-binding protein
MKRFLVLLLSLAAVVSAFAGGNSAKPAAEAAPTVTWLQGNAATFAEEDTPVLQAIEKATGVKFTVIQVAPGDYDAKLNTLIASRQLPDLFSVSISDALQFISEGMLAPLEDHLAQYGPNLQRELGQYIRMSPVNNTGDGHTYLIPGYGDTIVENLMVRVDWLKKLGLQMPTDLDSLYDVLYAFTYNDPDGNGKNDTVGIIFTMTQNNQWDVLFGAFGIAYNHPYQLANGTVTTYMKAPGYLEAIEYLRKLYSAGVMDREFATMPAMTAHERLWTGRVGVYGFRAVGTTNNWYPGRYTFPVPADPAEIFGYTDIKGPRGEHGASRVYRNVNSGFVVSSTAKYPEAAIKILDYLATEEGDTLTYLGVEGLMYEWIDKANGTYRRLGEFTDDSIHRAKGGYVYWAKIPEVNAEVRTLHKLTQDAQAFARATLIDWPYIINPFNAQSEYGRTLADIEKQALAQLIVTTGNVQNEYNSFIARWENEGGKQWEAEATAAYKAQPK